MDANVGPVRPVGAGDYQPPRKRASDPNKEDAEPRQPVPMPDQVAAVEDERKYLDIITPAPGREQQIEDLRAYLRQDKQRPLAEDEPARVLAHGLDTLYVTYEVEWAHKRAERSEPDLWGVLEDARLRAAGDHPEQVGTKEEGQYCMTGELLRIPGPHSYGDVFVNVLPGGKDGYKWMLRGRGFMLMLGRQLVPKSRPNVKLEIGSEVCWRHGGREFVEFVTALLSRHGGRVMTAKPSRVDFCVDLLVRDDAVTRRTEDHVVCRARKFHTYGEARKPIHALTVGEGGQVSLRVYDKPKEIADKGGVKAWFYDVWLIEPGDPRKVARVTKTGREIMQRLDHHIPEGHRVMRVEFEIKRESLKALGANTMADLFEEAAPIWQYLTADWCRFVDRPDIKADRQEVLPWWRVVQEAWPGTWEGPSAIRAVCPGREAEQLTRGGYGYLTSLVAAVRAAGGEGVDELADLSVDGLLAVFKEQIEKYQQPGDDATEGVRDKMAKYDKGVKKFKQASDLRRLMRPRSEQVRRQAQVEQPERSQRVEDGSRELAEGFWRRVFRVDAGREVEKPAEQKTPEKPPPPKQEQLELDV